MSKVDEQQTTHEPTPPPPPARRKKEPTIELDETDLIEVGDLLIEPSIVLPRTPPANDAERVFFHWTLESLVPIGARSSSEVEVAPAVTRPPARGRRRRRPSRPRA